MPRIGIPKDPLPNRTQKNHAYVIDTKGCRMVWVYDETGWLTTGNQYADSWRVAEYLGCSRSTAYRYMSKLPRYTLTDLRDPDAPRCTLVIKREAMRQIVIKREGNPNFNNGLYQQSLALRRGIKYLYRDPAGSSPFDY